MLAIIPQSELVQIPIPTVFERSLADETSAKMTYPSGPLFVFDKGKMNVENPSRSNLHANLVDKVVDDRLGTYGLAYRRRATWEGTYKGRDGPLGILVCIPYPDKSNQKQDDCAADHAPVEEEATAITVDSVKGQQISDDLCWSREAEDTRSASRNLTPMAVTPTPRLKALFVANPASSKKYVLNPKTKTTPNNIVSSFV